MRGPKCRYGRLQSRIRRGQLIKETGLEPDRQNTQSGRQIYRTTDRALRQFQLSDLLSNNRTRSVRPRPCNTQFQTRSMVSSSKTKRGYMRFPSASLPARSGDSRSKETVMTMSPLTHATGSLYGRGSCTATLVCQIWTGFGAVVLSGTTVSSRPDLLNLGVSTITGRFFVISGFIEPLEKSQIRISPRSGCRQMVMFKSAFGKVKQYAPTRRRCQKSRCLRFFRLVDGFSRSICP